MLLISVLPLFLHALSTTASVTIADPSDYVDFSADAADNAIKADYNVTAILYQTILLLWQQQYSYNQPGSCGPHGL